MTVSSWSDSITDSNGKPLRSTGFTVYAAATGNTLATIYADATGTTPISGSRTSTDALGNGVVNAAAGTYWGQADGHTDRFEIQVALGRGEASGTFVAQQQGTVAALATANPTPAANAVVYETDTKRTRRGDGSTAYVSLPNGPIRGEQALSLLHALPRLADAIRTYDDSVKPTLRFICDGSSVMLGPTGGADTVNTVEAYFFATISGLVNPLGNMVLTSTNAAVGGSTITSAQQTDYALAKTAAGGPPTVLLLGYGMNDGTSPQYHGNQTYPGVYTNGKALVQQAQSDGADVVIMTTPHPHSQRMTWAMGVTTVVYPTSTQTPDSTTAQSIVTVKSRGGKSVPASYRHLRVNQALRKLAADTGCVLLDVEKYWFDAVAQFGEDALFNVTGDTTETVHPNLFAFQQSYFRAIDDFAAGLAQPTVIAAPLPGATETFVRKANNTAYAANSTTQVADPDLQFVAGAGQTWEGEVTVFYAAGSTSDLRFNWNFPTGATGRWSVVGSDTAVAGVTGTATNRSTALGSGNYLNAGGNNSDNTVRIRFCFTTSTTAGTFGMKFSQDTSDANAPTVYANSMLIARRRS